MKHLFLVRHAKSRWADETPQGLAQTLRAKDIRKAVESRIKSVQQIDTQDLHVQIELLDQFRKAEARIQILTLGGLDGAPL